MSNSTRLLVGFSIAPPFNGGNIVIDEVRGEAEICAMTDAWIPCAPSFRGSIQKFRPRADSADHAAGTYVTGWGVEAT